MNKIIQDTIKFSDMFRPCNNCGRFADKCMCGMEFNPNTNEWEYHKEKGHFE